MSTDPRSANNVSAASASPAARIEELENALSDAMKFIQTIGWVCPYLTEEGEQQIADKFTKLWHILLPGWPDTDSDPLYGRPPWLRARNATFWDRLLGRGWAPK